MHLDMNSFIIITLVTRKNSLNLETNFFPLQKLCLYYFVDNFLSSNFSVFMEFLLFAC